MSDPHHSDHRDREDWPQRMRHTGIRNERTLGESLRGARLMQGLTQDELAARAGVSRKWLSNAETGDTSVRFGTLIQALDALGYSLTLDPLPDDANWLEEHIASFVRKL